jgi:hypothetical protein
MVEGNIAGGTNVDKELQGKGVGKRRSVDDDTGRTGVGGGESSGTENA